jgi:glucosylceramidase
MKATLITLTITILATATALPQSSIQSWITRHDRTELFARQPETIPLTPQPKGQGHTIIIDENHSMQSIDGFGFALTGGSAELLMHMTANTRRTLLREIFGHDGKNIGVSYLRLSIAASDLNSFVFSYNDLEEGQTDPQMQKFTLAQDRNDIIPIMKEILEITPHIKILASPWSPPTWMKTNKKVKGGELLPEYYDAYAQYLIRYIQDMKQEGITIDAITIQNEPLNTNNTPSMRMSAAQQADFIRNHLAPKLKQARLPTKIILFDHNLDRPDYPLSILNDPETSPCIDGTGFHHYGGEMETMSIIHSAFPDKNLYFTEQMVTERPGSKTIAIATQVKRLIIDGTNNWSRNILLWNLAADPNNDPHTNDGGCPICQGAITIDGNAVERNLAYYVIAHASKFVRPGSVRIATTQPGDRVISLTTDEEQRSITRIAGYVDNDILPNVAFRTPDNKIVLIVANTSGTASSFKIKYRSSYATLQLPQGSAGTYIIE